MQLTIDYFHWLSCRKPII